MSNSIFKRLARFIAGSPYVVPPSELPAVFCYKCGKQLAAQAGDRGGYTHVCNACFDRDFPRSLE